MKLKRIFTSKANQGLKNSRKAFSLAGAEAATLPDLKFVLSCNIEFKLEFNPKLKQSG